MAKLQPGGLTAEALIKRHGIALRWERTDPDNPRNGRYCPRAEVWEAYWDQETGDPQGRA